MLEFIPFQHVHRYASERTTKGLRGGTLAQQVATEVLTLNGMLYRDSMYTGMRPRAP